MIFQAVSSHLKHTYFPLSVSVLKIISDPLVYDVHGKSAALQVAYAESAYSLIEMFVSVTVAATVSLATGPATTSFVILIFGTVPSYVLESCVAALLLFHAQSWAVDHATSIVTVPSAVGVTSTV